VTVTNPLVGDEEKIEMKLFGRRIPKHHWPENRVIELQLALDGRMKKAALGKGYDAIVLMTPKAFARYRRYGSIPRSIELNTFPGVSQTASPQRVQR